MPTANLVQKVVLTSDERELLTRAFMHGLSVLYELGYSAEQVSAFFERSEVREEFDQLGREFNQRQTTEAATKFILTRQLARMGEGAVGVLAQAMMGTEYARDDEGNITLNEKGYPTVKNPGSSQVQVRAALGVLDRLGVDGSRHQDRAATINASVVYKQLSAQRVTIDDDPDLETHEQKVLSRERVRTLIEMVRGVVPAAQKRLISELSGDTKKKPKKSRNVKKRKKKKASKKSKAKS